MLEIKKINVLSTFGEFLLIKWELEDTLENVSDYTFSIYRSLSSDSNFELIAEGVTDFEFQYQIENLATSEVHWYFKVESVNTLTGESKLSDVFGALYLVERDPVAEAILYQEKYFLENLLGRPPVRLLMRRRTGQRCPVCWDEELQQVTRSQCTTCYNTGYVGGYVSTIIYISFTEPGFIEKFDLGDINDVQQGTSEAWTTNYPLILPKDVIVDEFNRRFRVLQVQPTTKGGRVYLRQILQLQLLPPTDVIYKFAI